MTGWSSHVISHGLLDPGRCDGDGTAWRTLSPERVFEALSHRERCEVRDALERASSARGRPAGPPAPPLSDEELARHISERAYDLIVEFETGGRAYYESPAGINKRPCWPGGQSGVTIGCGYDLGYNTAQDFQLAWSGRLAYEHLALLAGALNLKGPPARRYLRRVSHIVIDWGVALAVFDAVDLPAEARRTYRHLPSSIALHPHCFGALVSLVFNRGASFELPGDRYREMRAIKRMVESGDVAGIPAQIRAMKRLWVGQGLDGLLARRDKEAALFQAGLDAMHVARQSKDTARKFAAGPARLGPQDDPADMSWLRELTDDQLDEALYGGQPDDGEPRSDDTSWGLRARLDASDVSWVRNDANHPDYAHLPPDAKFRSFRFSPDDLEALIRLNRFDPHYGMHNKLIFALRGCRLSSGDHQEAVSELLLTDERPDHFTFHCLIGIYDRAARMLSAYKASTVCNANAVVKCYNYYAGHSNTKEGNILLTGCYQMCVGTHIGSATIPGVFRLGTGPSSDTATKHTVLRTDTDVTFGTKDVFDPCTPKDNLHPAMRETGSFSSLGCLTVRGSYDGQHSGLWKKFRAAAGLHASDDQNGVRYDLVMLTGLEAATLDLLRGSSAENIHETLACLRQGSRGPDVAKLQSKLQVASPSGVFDWNTAHQLAKHQKQQLGWATATYGRHMDGLLGFEIFGPALVS